MLLLCILVGHILQMLPSVSLLKEDEYLEFKDIEPCYKCIEVNLRGCITLKVE